MNIIHKMLIYFRFPRCAAFNIGCNYPVAMPRDYLTIDDRLNPAALVFPTKEPPHVHNGESSHEQQRFKEPDELPMEWSVD
jgi:hypothetical protein